MGLGRCVLLAGACSAGLVLGGCVAQPGNYGAAGGYAAPGYAAPGQPGDGAPGYGYGYPGAGAQGYGYAAGPAPGQPYVGPDGLTYVDGVPVGAADGEQVGYVYVGGLGGWGYYDHDRRWHGAPDGLRDRLERSHPGGRGLPPDAYNRRFDRPAPGRGGVERTSFGQPGEHGPAPGRGFFPGGNPGSPGAPGAPGQVFRGQGPGEVRAPGPGPSGGGAEQANPGQPGERGPGPGRGFFPGGGPGGPGGPGAPGQVFRGQGPGEVRPPGPEGQRPVVQARPPAPRPAPPPPPRCAPGQARC